MARIDIEIEEYLDEVRTKYLFDELKNRKDFNKLIEEYYTGDEMPNYIIPDFKTAEEKLDFLKLVLGLKKWHDKKRIITEINEL